MTDFSTTAVLLTLFGVLLVAGAGLSRGLERAGVPVALLFLGLGMLAGSEGLVGIAYEDYRFSFIVGTLALVLIVFDGGFNTSWSSIRAAWGPALVLATFGVIGTAALTAVFAHWLGLTWSEAILLGAEFKNTVQMCIVQQLPRIGPC